MSRLAGARSTNQTYAMRNEHINTTSNYILVRGREQYQLGNYYIALCHELGIYICLLLLFTQPIAYQDRLSWNRDDDCLHCYYFSE